MKKKEEKAIGTEVGETLAAQLKEAPPGRFKVNKPATCIDKIEGRVLEEGMRPTWGLRRAGWIPKIDGQSIQKSISEKSSKIIEYKRKCNELWLVISVEGSQPSSFLSVEGRALGLDYITSFDRVYVLDFQKKSCCRLNLRS